MEKSAGRRNRRECIKEEWLQKIELSLKSLRIADLELFITAAHARSLGKSATLHHLSQSAASTAIQRVESAFGLSLCTHEKRQFRLTREGQILFPRIEHWVRQLREMIISKDHIPIRLVTTHAIAQIAVPALFSIGDIEFQQLRPDHAYAAILHDRADVALVLDNDQWKAVAAAEISRGNFQLYCKQKDVPLKPVLLPEDQMEVHSLQQSWIEAHGYSIPVKSRIPSWSLIAAICSNSSEVGFLPDFLANKIGLHPVKWQPATAQYRILALYRPAEKQWQIRCDHLLHNLRSIFTTRIDF